MANQGGVGTSHLALLVKQKQRNVATMNALGLSRSSPATSSSSPSMRGAVPPVKSAPPATPQQAATPATSAMTIKSDEDMILATQQFLESITKMG